MYHRIPSIDKIRTAIGWEPTHDLERILGDVVDHARHQPIVAAAG